MNQSNATVGLQPYGIALALAAGVGGGDAAAASFFGPTPYLQFADSPFAGLSFTRFYREDFEDNAFNPQGATKDEPWSVLSPGELTDSVDADDGAVNGSGRAGHSLYSSGQHSLTIRFDANRLGGRLPDHAGLVWTDVGITSAGTPATVPVAFEAFDAMGASLGSLTPVGLGNASAAGETDDDWFFGVANAGGISAIKISMPDSTDWEVDHLQYGVAAVPLPPSAMLFGTGLCIALARRRR